MDNTTSYSDHALITDSSHGKSQYIQLSVYTVMGFALSDLQPLVV